MTLKRATPLVLAAVAFGASGCGGGTSAGSDTVGATGDVAGTVDTVSTTTAEGSASFDVRWDRVQTQLSRGLKQLENGDAADKVAGAGTILTTCTDSVTNGLGSRADTADQQEAVSHLRTACKDASEAAAKLKDGDESAAQRLAQTALQELQDANDAMK